MKHPLDLHRDRRTWHGWKQERALLRPRRSRVRFGRNELAGMLLAGIVGGLAWSMLPAAMPDRSDGLAGFERVEPDSWKESRRSREILSAQEGAPASRYGVAAPLADPATPALRSTFGLCHRGGGTNCVVDGDTFWMAGVKIRIADIDTPETHPARCAEEARLGAAATQRLQALLNSGVVTLHPIGRDTDRYGRKLRRVEVDGRGVGDRLVAEGLARPYLGRRMGWCG
ncbi:MAG: thermonuclease family protein [Sphingomonas sp.]